MLAGYDNRGWQSCISAAILVSCNRYLQLVLVDGQEQDIHVSSKEVLSPIVNIKAGDLFDLTSHLRHVEAANASAALVPIL